MSHTANLYVKHLTIAPNGERITASEKSVLGQLADDHREEVGAAWRSMSETAALACVSTVQCRRIMRSLEKKGVIETMPNFQPVKGSDKFRQVSNEFRFCQIDPPFDAKSVALTAARMKYQKIQRERRPVQTSFLPPITGDRGGRSPMTAGGGHLRKGGAITDDRGGRSPMIGQDPLIDPSVDPEVSIPFDPKGDIPTLLAKGETLPDRAKRDERWDNVIAQLKEDLCSVPANVAKAKGFSEVLPGQNDFDTCFRAWWLVSARNMPNGMLCFTVAENDELTEAGIDKYKERLAKLVRRFFSLDKKKPVNFKVLRHAGAQTAETVVPVLVLTAPPSQSAAAESKPDPWTAVKAEIEQRLMRLSPQSAVEHAMKNFREAIEPVRLVSVEMDGAEPVWKLAAINATKTRAVLGLLRLHVVAAIRTTQNGAVVQLLVMNQTGQ